MTDPFRPLLDQARRTLEAVPDLARFAPELTPDLPLEPGRPNMLAALGRLESIARHPATPGTRPLADALLIAAPALPWRHSYSTAQVGTAFLSGYASFNLVSPGGAFRHPGLRVTLAFWDRGLSYPRHRHAPAEHYLVLAGAAEFGADGMPVRRVGPGDTVFHPAWLPHAMEMREAPLLALVIWEGEGLQDDPEVLSPAAGR